ncbi:hypothetical protein Anapl_15481 [Anas platyrhynchos]|uniref:Uncharacterized protein n=1 Tax=Anas platyrhynchos TaxID=8839 RepID=R0K039_ANAPL|nr:hypothetical protein Anapl_15481 [Anas platyrhynchos]
MLHDKENCQPNALHHCFCTTRCVILEGLVGSHLVKARQHGKGKHDTKNGEGPSKRMDEECLGTAQHLAVTAAQKCGTFKDKVTDLADMQCSQGHLHKHSNIRTHRAYTRMHEGLKAATGVTSRVKDPSTHRASKQTLYFWCAHIFVHISSPSFRRGSWKGAGNRDQLVDMCTRSPYKDVYWQSQLHESNDRFGKVSGEITNANITMKCMYTLYYGSIENRRTSSGQAACVTGISTNSLCSTTELQWLFTLTNGAVWMPLKQRQQHWHRSYQNVHPRDLAPTGKTSHLCFPPAAKSHYSISTHKGFPRPHTTKREEPHHLQDRWLPARFPQLADTFLKAAAGLLPWRLGCPRSSRQGDWDPGAATRQPEYLSPAAGGIHLVHVPTDLLTSGLPSCLARKGSGMRPFALSLCAGALSTPHAQLYQCTDVHACWEYSSSLALVGQQQQHYFVQAVGCGMICLPLTVLSQMLPLELLSTSRSSR